MAQRKKTPAQKSGDTARMLAEAFLLYAEEGMDDADNIEQVLCGLYDPDHAAKMRRLLDKEREELDNR